MWLVLPDGDSLEQRDSHILRDNDSATTVLVLYSSARRMNSSLPGTGTALQINQVSIMSEGRFSSCQPSPAAAKVVPGGPSESLAVSCL